MPANAKSPAPILWITPQSQLESVLARSGARHLAVFTSDPASIIPPRTVAKADFLMLEFNDITAPQSGLISPDRGHIKKLLEFAASRPEDTSLVLSCYAGISRSTAAAFILVCQSHADICEMEIAQKLRHAAPSATPNMLMVSLADNLMGRDGRMVKAIEAIGRGEDAFQGTPFQLVMSVGPNENIAASGYPAQPIGEILP